MSKEQPHFGEVFIFRRDKDWTAVMYVSPANDGMPSDVWYGQTLSGGGSLRGVTGEILARVPLTRDPHAQWMEADNA